MINQILHKIFSISLSLLVLLSTVSFTIEKHFCGDTLIDIAVFTEAEKCGMESLNNGKYLKKSCCKDTLDVIEGQDVIILKGSNDYDLDFPQLVLTTYIFSYINLFEGLPEQIIPFKDYSPPNLIYDIQTLDEVYLI